jgi:Asp-tRNA(Asn)/Glu-tRNA(Gln) amidotransferase A subunit family amidase
VNRQVNGVVAMDEERARREARAAEQAVMKGGPLGLLHGLPVGIKDLVDTEGLRTTHGSPPSIRRACADRSSAAWRRPSPTPLPRPAARACAACR